MHAAGSAGGKKAAGTVLPHPIELHRVKDLFALALAVLEDELDSARERGAPPFASWSWSRRKSSSRNGMSQPLQQQPFWLQRNRSIGSDRRTLEAGSGGASRGGGTTCSESFMPPSYRRSSPIRDRPGRRAPASA